MSLRTIVIVCAVLLAAFALDANASTIRSDVADSKYTALGSNYSSSVGYIYETTSSGTYIGSGTIVSSNSSGAWILTAAHVVDDATALSFTINGSTYQSDRWKYYSSISDSNVASSSVGDVGLLHVSSVISGASAASLYTGSTSSLQGGTATFVGYGNTGTGSTGAKSGTYGTLRAVQNVLDTTASSEWGSSYSSSVLLSDFDSPSSVSSSTKSTSGTSGAFAKFVRTDKVGNYAGLRNGGGLAGNGGPNKNGGPINNGGPNKNGGPINNGGQNNNSGKGNNGGNSNNGGNNSSSSNNTITSGSATPLELEGLIAGGDSGGGVFATVNGSQYLVGINSFVSYTDGSSDSDYGDISGCVSVSSYASWINGIISDSSTSTTSLTSTSTTKALSFKGVRDYSANALMLTDTAIVPEPSVFCLLGTALAAFGVWRRCRRARR